MKNYFLVLDKDQINKIQGAEVEFCDLKIDGQAGVVIDEENVNPALESLGLAVVTETETSLEGIVRVELGTTGHPELSDPKFQVEIKNWNGEQKGEFARITEQTLLPVVKRNIFLGVPHQETVPPAESGFNIWIWSAASGAANTKPPAEMWGVKVDCRDKGYTPTGQGVVVFDDTGWPVAEIVNENNLYIFHDICHEGTNHELQIYQRILEEVVSEFSLSPEEKAERQQKLAEERRRKSRERYIAECSKRFEKTVKGTKKKIETGHREIEELQKRLTRKIRETRGAERKLEQLNASADSQLENYGKEFDSLSAVPGVEDVQVSDGVIKVFTEHIYITPDGYSDTFDIGKFRMEIYTSGANGGIRFFNITRKGSGNGYNIHHPHVNSSGSPCLGNIKELVSQLIGEYEYSAVAQLGLQYLKSVNINDSAGEGIFKYWPKKEEK